MTDEEVNKIIAEFMGYIVRYEVDGALALEDSPMRGITYYSKYTESLDALVPVWERLDSEFCDIKLHVRFKEVMIYDLACSSGHGDTLQQAAAHATAKAINELQKK